MILFTGVRLRLHTPGHADVVKIRWQLWAGGSHCILSDDYENSVVF